MPTMPKVFISHSWIDNDISRKIAHDLKRDGAAIWIDYARISGGESLPERISWALEWCDTLVLVWSKSAAASKWVTKEWSSALSLDRTIIPCLLDNTKLPAILCSLLYIDFKNFDTGYNDLCRAFKLQTIEEKKKAEAEKKKIEQERSEVKRKEKEKQIFRSKPTSLSGEQVKAMLAKNDFFDSTRNISAKGFNNQFETKIYNGRSVVIDYASWLMWQQEGSANYMTYDGAKKYIQELNHNKFAGFSDWRLPTLEEAMSLMKPKLMNGDLHIDPKFNNTQWRIWTSDPIMDSAREQWVVYFDVGHCHYYHHLPLTNYVRAVRFGQSSPE